MAEPNSQPLRFTLTHYRNPKHTHEDFMNWLVTGHLPLAMPVFKRHGMLEYKLFTTPPSLNSTLKTTMQQTRPTWDFADFDCFIEYTLPDMSVIGKVMTDPEWAEAIKDEAEWVDSSRALCAVGYVTPYLERSGEVVNMDK